MEKAIFFTPKTFKKISLPFNFKKVSKKEEIYKKDFSIFIFDEDFLKKYKINFSKILNKVCIVFFRKKVDLELLKKFDFFDYLFEKEEKSEILFKLKRAIEFLKLKKEFSNLKDTIKKKYEIQEELTLIDPILGCYNWRYFLSRISQEISRACRHNYKISIIGIGIDNLQELGELYGLKLADFVLRRVFEILRTNLRKEDIISRWKGDEFFIILPYLSKEDSFKVAKRLKNLIENSEFKYKKIKVKIKVSMGLISCKEDRLFNTQDIVNTLERYISQAKIKGKGVIISSKSDILDKNFIYEEHLRTDNFEELKKRIEKLNRLLNTELLEMIYGFAKAIEAKDAYTAKHVEDVALIAQKIAQELKLAPSEIENIKWAAILHDLGKVGIDERILSKKGKLNKKENEIIRKHPWIAVEILREIRALRGTIPAILYHHERYDGKGYPLGLKGEEIPLGARIVAVADVYQALVSERPYRKAYSKKEAVRIIKKESGKQFDPKIVDIFIKIIKEID